MKEYAGTSVGGLFSVLLAFGYKPSELICKIVDEPRTLDLTSILRSGVDHLLKVMTDLLKEKEPGIDLMTFTMKQFYEKTGKTVHLISTCINSASTIVINHKTYPEMPMGLAIRATTAIPILFPPVIQGAHCLVDGAVTCKFPSHVLESKGPNLGIDFLPSEERECGKCEPVGNMLLRVMQAVTSNVYLGGKAQNSECEHVIQLNGEGLNTYETNISSSKIWHNIRKGYFQAREWDTKKSKRVRSQSV
jgi:predicted acylesterase/phospholipase RssA